MPAAAACRGKSSRPGGRCLLAACALVVAYNQRAFVSPLPQFRSRQSVARGSVTGHAEGAPSDVAVEGYEAISDAPEYKPEVDAISGELDLSSVPDGMGIYAVFNNEKKLQYVGLSRNLRKSLTGHAEAIGGQAGLTMASIHVWERPDATKGELSATWEKWIKGHMSAGGEVPPGNLPDGAKGADPRWRAKAQGPPPLSLPNAGDLDSAMAAVGAAVEKHPTLLFMKGTPIQPQCGFSARVAAMMKEIGVKYESVNVLDDASNPGVREAVKQYSNWPTIPQLFVGGKLVGGCDILTEMFESGTLKSTIEAGGNSAESTASDSSAAVPIDPQNIGLVNDEKRPTATTISDVLSKQFTLHSFKIVDESALHEGDAGALEMGLTGESHFNLELAAPEFEGKSPLERQQEVFAALSEVMPRIHALSITARTPAEMAA